MTTHAEVEPPTRLHPTRKKLAASPVITVRETLRTGCVLCGGRDHAARVCPLGIDNGRGGVA